MLLINNNNIIKDIKTGFEDKIVNPKTNIFNDIKTGFEDKIINPVNDIINNIELPIIGDTTQKPKQPISNNSNNDNYIYIGVALKAAFIFF